MYIFYFVCASFQILLFILKWSLSERRIKEIYIYAKNLDCWARCQDTIFPGGKREKSTYSYSFFFAVAKRKKTSHFYHSLAIVPNKHQVMNLIHFPLSQSYFPFIVLSNFDSVCFFLLFFQINNLIRTFNVRFRSFSNSCFVLFKAHILGHLRCSTSEIQQIKRQTTTKKLNQKPTWRGTGKHFSFLVTASQTGKLKPNNKEEIQSIFLPITKRGKKTWIPVFCSEFFMHTEQQHQQ